MLVKFWAGKLRYNKLIAVLLREVYVLYCTSTVLLREVEYM